MEKAFSFDDILILPHFKSDIYSRGVVDVSTEFFGSKLDLPAISASMSAFDTTDPESRNISWQFASLMSDSGGMHIFSRSTLFDERYEAASSLGKSGKSVGLAVSIEEFFAFREKLEELEAFVSIDIANGAILKDIHWEGKYPLIVGNFGNPRVINRTDFRGNIIYKFGIGGGSSCSTRLQTGVGAPQGWLIYHASEKSERYDENEKLFISDGGVKSTADFVKSLALGANAVMMGYMFASAEEAPWEPVKIDGNWYKPYRGMASSKEKNNNSHVEGVSGYVPYIGKPLKTIMLELHDGLSSAMSYSDAKNLKSFKDNAEFIFSPSSNIENQTRLNHG